MTENDRNTRTLIVCFVIALMVMIPLRFVEVGNIMDVQNQQVLGETTEVIVTEPKKVPAVNIDAKLEAPYDEIDGPSIISR